MGTEVHGFVSVEEVIRYFLDVDGAPPGVRTWCSDNGVVFEKETAGARLAVAVLFVGSTNHVSTMLSANCDAAYLLLSFEQLITLLTNDLSII